MAVRVHMAGRKRLLPRLTITRRMSLIGYLFAMPFVVGFLLFFLLPFVQSIIFSLSEIEIGSYGYSISFVGFKNYRSTLLVHPTFVRTFVETVVKVLFDVPLVLMFSFFAATLLNQQFRGRTVARLVFFLPVVLASGVVYSMELGNYMMNALRPGAEQGISGGSILSGASVRAFVYQLKLPMAMLNHVIGVVDRIPHVINSSGIQILVFLAGLQSISPSLYEASAIEGATAWEDFWKITFPLMSPLVLTNIVYTVVDSFTAPGNQLVSLIRDTAFGGMGFGVSSAMSWMYFAAIGVILAVAIGIVSRSVFYQE